MVTLINSISGDSSQFQPRSGVSARDFAREVGFAPRDGTEFAVFDKSQRDVSGTDVLTLDNQVLMISPPTVRDGCK